MPLAVCVAEASLAVTASGWLNKPGSELSPRFGFLSRGFLSTLLTVSLMSYHQMFLKPR